MPKKRGYEPIDLKKFMEEHKLDTTGFDKISILCFGQPIYKKVVFLVSEEDMFSVYWTKILEGEAPVGKTSVPYVDIVTYGKEPKKFSRDEILKQAMAGRRAMPDVALLLVDDKLPNELTTDEKINLAAMKYYLSKKTLREKTRYIG